MALRDNNDFAFLLVNMLETALKITSTVYKTVEDCLDDVMDSKLRDKINVAALLIDTGIIDTVSALLVLTWTAKSAQIELKSSGAISIEAAENQQVYVQNQSSAATPTPAITQGIWRAQLAGHLTEIGGIVTEATTSIKSFVEDKNKKDEVEEL
jgi:hypothetical protein